MALVKGTNSYATVTEADSYLADKLDVAAWDAASPAERAKALVTATRYLDGLNWAGTAVSASQLLAFPREGVYFEPRLGFEVALDSSATPARVLQAVYELAYHFLNNDGLLDDTGVIKGLSIGAIDLKEISDSNKIPSHIRSIIKPLLVNNGSNLWYRAN